MAKAIVIYYSRTGNTKKMAESVLEGLQKENVEAALKDAASVDVDELLKYDAILIGSPTY
ncbi:MAG: flavodoxin family protein, partial [Candidatus Omnitrophica bacterium]|nr:flavodoxin family protein [Candidatus Omnitrophota bacterium]